jgi:carboxypeptidase family protein
VRVVHFHCACRLRTLSLGLVAAALFVVAACHGGPVIDLGTKPVQADGTISGTVRGPENTSAIEGRSVEVINVDTGERQRVTTNNAGGFSVKVKPGNYRVELTLLDGEMIVKKPDVIHVNRSDVDAHADFVLGAARVSRPRNRAPRADDGLGSAIARLRSSDVELIGAKQGAAGRYTRAHETPEPLD